MKKIQLGGRKYSKITGYALVDDEDFEELNKHKWSACWWKDVDSFYATRVCRKEEERQGIISMHREILGLKKGDGLQGDHINHDTLDNRRSNLRICTRKENMRNRGKFANNKSGLKGVSWKKNMNKWTAQIVISGKTICLGFFINKNDAYQAYCDASTKYHGAFSNTG